MAKKKVEKPQRVMTKRQISHWEQQKRRQRITLIVGIIIIAAVIIIAGTGWFTKEYYPLHQTVIRVNGVGFDMSYYINMLKYYSSGQPQIMPYLTDQIVELIQKGELTRQAALELGISVSDEEVDKELKSRKLGSEYRDPVRVSLVMNKLLESSFIDSQVPATAEHRQVMAMLLESDSQLTEVSGRIEKGENFSDLAGTLSLDSNTKSKKGDLGWHSKDALALQINNPKLVDLAFNTESNILTKMYEETQSKNVGYWLVKVLEKSEEPKTAKVQVILTGSKEEALKVKARLDGGEDFATVAKEVSQHSASKDKGGDLGDIKPGEQSKVIDEYVFNAQTKLNTLSDPIRDESMTTKGGYWLFKVTGVEDRKIEGDDRNLLKSKVLSDWVDGLMADQNNVVENYLDEANKAYAIQQASKL